MEMLRSSLLKVGSSCRHWGKVLMASKFNYRLLSSTLATSCSLVCCGQPVLLGYQTFSLYWLSPIRNCDRDTYECVYYVIARVRLAVHRDTRECVAVKMMSIDHTGHGLTQDILRKEVS